MNEEEKKGLFKTVTDLAGKGVGVTLIEPCVSCGMNRWDRRWHDMRSGECIQKDRALPLAWLACTLMDLYEGGRYPGNTKIRISMPGLHGGHVRMWAGSFYLSDTKDGKVLTIVAASEE